MYMDRDRKLFIKNSDLKKTERMGNVNVGEITGTRHIDLIGINIYWEKKN